MKSMYLYKEESAEIIFRTQMQDPFFDSLSETIFKYITQPHARLLDLGCGCGRNIVIAAEKGYKVVGVDGEKISLGIARKYLRKRNIISNVKLICADISHLETRQYGLFDYIIMQEVIEHIPNFQKLIDFAYYSLRPGGKLLITTPHDPKQWNIFDEYARHVRRFSINDINEALLRFRSVRIHTMGFPLHRLMLVIYDALLKSIGKTHQAKSFRANSTFHRLYYFVGKIIMKIDSVFNSSNLGDTILAVAEK